jgi:thioredoxin-dependent adenylylsulfate APS reductase
MVLIDMLSRIDPTARIFTIDTLRLPTETYSLMDRVRELYGIRLEVYYPQMENVENLTGQYGFSPFYKSVKLRKLCCNIRKVEPLRRALADLDAWITAIRRDQVETRAGAGKVEIDDTHGGIVKVNPLADWTSERVWAYIRAHDVPYNELHERGYPSIGCAPCTRAVASGEDPRAGRWWWEHDRQDAECGIHTAPNWQI